MILWNDLKLEGTKGKFGNKSCSDQKLGLRISNFQCISSHC